MTITINLTSASGVSFNAAYNAYFKDFTAEGWPYILGGPSQFQGKEIVLLDSIVAGQESKTKAIILDGQSFNYFFNDHTLSGTLTTVRLSTLGNSYNPSTGGFTQSSSGLIANVSTTIEIKGLKITNAYRDPGDFHDTVTGLMGGNPGTSTATNPAKLSAFLWAQAHNVNGSAGPDTYTGSKFADTISGSGGNDKLNGASGNDKIYGGAGADRLIGGIGNDQIRGNSGADDLYGSGGADTFVFGALSDSTVSASGLDTIFDFQVTDKISLSLLDAKSGLAGNQAFAFIGAAAFSDTAGELRYQKVASDTYIYGDVNGDGNADFAIHLDDAVTLKGDYFIL